jgi:hypothetical protein
MANIAIVSSTEFGGSNQACFEAGLASCLGGKSKPTILGSFQSKGNYDVTVLREWIRTAVKNNPSRLLKMQRKWHWLRGGVVYEFLKRCRHCLFGSLLSFKRLLRSTWAT